MHIAENHCRTRDLTTMECKEKFSKRDSNEMISTPGLRPLECACVCLCVHVLIFVCICNQNCLMHTYKHIVYFYSRICVWHSEVTHLKLLSLAYKSPVGSEGYHCQTVPLPPALFDP